MTLNVPIDSKSIQSSAAFESGSSSTPSTAFKNMAVVVLTRNEEKYIDDCLKSVAWCSEIWVVDTGSSDNTVEVCRRHTHNIVRHDFSDFSQSRNWALDNLAIQSEWILFLDSDERISQDLRRELEAAIRDKLTNGYYVPMKQYFWGQWLKHGGSWPNYSLRLFRRGRARYSRTLVHEFAEVVGNVRYLTHPIIHVSRSSMSEALRKLDVYTSLEARRLYRFGGSSYVSRKDDSPAKRVLKRVYPRLPGKPLFQFAYSYILLQGFRDGYVGFVWAFIQSLYVFVVNFKLWELRTFPHTESDPP